MFFMVPRIPMSLNVTKKTMMRNPMGISIVNPNAHLAVVFIPLRIGLGLTQSGSFKRFFATNTFLFLLTCLSLYEPWALCFWVHLLRLKECTKYNGYCESQSSSQPTGQWNTREALYPFCALSSSQTQDRMRCRRGREVISSCNLPGDIWNTPCWFEYRTRE